MRKDSYWFRHDSTAGRGLRMRKMAHIYGHWGKGIYWDVIEILRDQSDYSFNYDDSSLQLLCDLIGCKDEVKFINWIKDCVKITLLEVCDNKLFSRILCENMGVWEIKKQNGSKGGRPEKPKHNLTNNLTETKTKANRNHNIIEDNIREEKKKKDISILFRESEFFDVSKLKAKFIQEPKYALADIDHYHEAALNWSDSKSNKKIDWVATIRGFMQRDLTEGKLKVKSKEIIKKEIVDPNEFWGTDIDWSKYPNHPENPKNKVNA